MKARIFFLLLALLLSACAPQATATPEALPAPTALATEPPAPLLPTDGPEIVLPTEAAPQPVATATLVILPAATAILPVTTAFYNPYAVILLESGDVLNIRSAAGTGHAILGTLPPATTNVNRSGPVSGAGGSDWVEIQTAGGTGWVNSHFLTEYVAPSVFCSDARVTSLLDNLETALLTANGELFGSLVSPVHGLDLRLWRYGASANYSPKEAAWAFSSDYVVSWGPAPGSGEETLGTFSAQPLPKLQEVFGADYSLHCNDTLDLATFSLAPWPFEYANVNFYTLYKPGSEPYGGLDWRAWIVGIEYVQGQPTLFALIHFQWEP